MPTTSSERAETSTAIHAMRATTNGNKSAPVSSQLGKRPPRRAEYTVACHIAGELRTRVGRRSACFSRARVAEAQTMASPNP